MKGNRIVLAEDDTTLTYVIEEALKDIGVAALAASDGAAALTLLRENAIPILITDVRMPKMDGYELVKHALTEHPDLKVIMMTGYAEENPPNDVLKAREFRFIRKPVAMSALQSLIADMLSRP